VVHDEPDGIATFATAKTFVDFLARGDCEGWRLFVMKRTVAKVIGTSFFEFDETADNVYDVDSVLYLLYSLFADQGCKYKFFR
jgi:hypothetical protein